VRLHIDSLDDITSDLVTFQNIEPAVSSEELQILAERILPYNDNSIEKAKFSVRNILNTVPKSLDDLIDYSTPERLQDFISTVFRESFVSIDHLGSKIQTLAQLSQIMKKEPTFLIDIICNSQMDIARQIPLEDTPGITDRQKMLYNACNYYLNHKIGFACNSVWLACYLSSQKFGCSSGWLHIDGELCNNRNFGLKDDAAVVKLILGSLAYISQFLRAYRNDDFIQDSESLQPMLRCILIP
jgi:hypothetical protein